MESLPLYLQQFLLAVKQYFNQSISLKREKAAISMSTFSKCQERMVCKWIFLFMSVLFYFLQFVCSLSFCSGFELSRVSPCIFTLFESIFCYFPAFLGYCKTILGSEETFDADCFLRKCLIERYVELLRMSFDTFNSEMLFLKYLDFTPVPTALDQGLSISPKALGKVLIFHWWNVITLYLVSPI